MEYQDLKTSEDRLFDNRYVLHRKMVRFFWWSVVIITLGLIVSLFYREYQDVEAITRKQVFESVKRSNNIPEYKITVYEQ